jgi:hypothetical protein
MHKTTNQSCGAPSTFKLKTDKQSNTSKINYNSPSVHHGFGIMSHSNAIPSSRSVVDPSVPFYYALKSLWSLTHSIVTSQST